MKKFALLANCTTREMMRAFEVYLNQEKLCLAGIGDDGVLSAIVNWVARGGEGDMFLTVGGLLTLTDEHVRWVRQKALQVGDTIQIKIVEKQAVNEPTERQMSQQRDPVPREQNSN